ncbi:carboxypeptidase C [Xylariaceae sp. FL0016]|nr:carboxypeptidase C [Xylariaceae sp. FL0016]
MAWSAKYCLAIALLSAAQARAQFPPEPKGITLLKSRFHENVTISYKEPEICETTPGVKSYSGYVHLPPGFLDDDDGDDRESQNYPINTFFWFFESRHDPLNAPLAIWLNGGPGGSSMMGLLEENGPCFIAADSQSTVLNPWSWNREVNMLYLDQPVQVGFSYDVLTNATVYPSLGGDEDEDDDRAFRIVPSDFSAGVPETNLTMRVGTFGSQNISQTANSTARAAHALWHFAQTWFTDFPHYRPVDDRVSLWAESYGGHYGPGIFSFFQEMNGRIEDRSLIRSSGTEAHYIHLDTLGIVNGLLDAVVQHESFIQFPFNNTYGIQVFNESLYSSLLDDWTRPGGCKEQVQRCQDSLKTSHATTSLPTNLTEACSAEAEACAMAPWNAYQQLSGRGWFDIAHPHADPFPSPTMLGYLTQSHVLSALGVPVNFTATSLPVSSAFDGTHDVARGGFVDALAELLDAGVKVHLMYGDRDFACNWIGGEAASLAVPYAHAGAFADAGYAPLVSEKGWGGMTRQQGNFSFSRVFQAGHEVPRYAPEAAYAVFHRATFNRDIATGSMPLTDDYATMGPRDTWEVKNKVPVSPRPRCYVLKPETCTPDAWESVLNGTAVVRDWFVMDRVEDTSAALSIETQNIIGEL